MYTKGSRLPVGYLATLSAMRASIVATRLHVGEIEFINQRKRGMRMRRKMRRSVICDDEKRQLAAEADE